MYLVNLKLGEEAGASIYREISKFTNLRTLDICIYIIYKVNLIGAMEIGGDVMFALSEKLKMLKNMKEINICIILLKPRIML